jgi:hypothetical protein
VLGGCLGGLVAASSAHAQSGIQPSAEGYTLYDRLAAPLIAKTTIAKPEAAETPALGCQRYEQIAEMIIRFALGASLERGLSLDSPRADAQRQTADMMIGLAQDDMTTLASAGATIEQCGAAARSYGAQAFSVAREINGTNVARVAAAVAPPETKPTAPTKSEEEIADEAAAKAAVDKLIQEEEEARHMADEKAAHAFANLGPVAPAPPKSQAKSTTFNVYLIDTKAMREAKDFKVCFEPGLYQRAAKPVVDLASAALEIPEVAPLVDQAVGDFFDRLRPALARRFAFPADRLSLEVGPQGATRGPVAAPIKAVTEGCHLYLASRPPPLAYDDSTTKFGLLAENLVEDVITRPALETRMAALPILANALKPAAVAAAEAEAEVEVTAPKPTLSSRPEIARCDQDARCQAGAALAINACLLTAERRYGKAALARELEARKPVAAALDKDTYDKAVNRDFDLITANLEMIDHELNAKLLELQQDGGKLRSAAGKYLSSQELDAVTSAGEAEGEQSMGAPVLQCFNRIADGRSLELIAAQ